MRSENSKNAIDTAEVDAGVTRTAGKSKGEDEAVEDGPKIRGRLFEPVQAAAELADEFPATAIAERVTGRRKNVNVFVDFAVQEGEVDVERVDMAAESSSEREEEADGDAVGDGSVRFGFVVVDTVLLMAPPHTEAGLEATIGLLTDDDASREGLATRRKLDGNREDLGVDDTIHLVVVRFLSGGETVLSSERLEVLITTSPVRREVLGHRRRMLGCGSGRASESGGIDGRRRSGCVDGSRRSGGRRWRDGWRGVGRDGRRG